MAWKFEPKELGLKGVYEIQLEPRGDDRGFFMRVYDDKVFEELGLHRKWVQENHSLSKVKGTLRGLHFQYAPDCETKLLRAVTGEAFFAVADLRKGSPTFGKWTSMILSANKHNVLLVPKGCANGMVTLNDNVHLVYKIDSYYAPHNEDILKWDDPQVGIKWPIKTPAVISEKDMKGRSFKDIIEKTNGGIVI